MADGFLDFTVIPELPLATLALGMRRLYDGSLTAIAGVHRVRASRLEVLSPVPVELDGEPRPPGPLTLSLLPRALQVRGGWLHPPAVPTR
jgi:diacylglycerol kinase family enzyme